MKVWDNSPAHSISNHLASEDKEAALSTTTPSLASSLTWDKGKA